MRGNDLATVRISAFSGAIPSNNSYENKNTQIFFNGNLKNNILYHMDTKDKVPRFQTVSIVVIKSTKSAI